MSLWFKDLPKGWEEAPLKSRLARNDGGVWGEDPAGDDTDTVVLRSTEQRVDGAWNIEAPALRKLTKAEAESGRLHVGDLVVTKSSGSELHIGKTSLVTPEVAALNACYSNFMQRLRVDERTDPRFVHYWMNNELCREQFAYLSNSTSGLANLNGTVLGTARLAFPPHEEQTHIANFLDEQTARIDALIAEKEALLERLRELWTSAVAAAMAGARSPDRVPTHYSYYPTVPSNWRVVPFKHAVQFVEGPGILAEDFRDEGVPLLRVSCVRDSIATLDGCNFLDPEKVAKKWSHFRVREGDLLISASASMGTVSLVTAQTAGAVPYTGIIILRPVEGIAVREFIEHFVVSDQFTRQIDGFKAGATIQHFGPTHLKQMVLAIPFELDEQRRIAAELTSVRTEHSKLETHTQEHITRLREYRSSLISAAVTGQLDLSTFKAAA